MALPKAMSAMTCTARHSVLLEVRPRSCLSAAGRVTGALSRQHGHGGGAHLPPGHRSAAAREVRTACPPSVSFCPQAQERRRRGEGIQEHRRRLESGLCGEGLRLPGAWPTRALPARGSSGGTEGRGRYRARRLPPPLRHLPGLTPGAEARAMPRPRQDSP